MAMAHVPVLTQELLDLLDCAGRQSVVDCTFGRAADTPEPWCGTRSARVLVACDQDR